MVKIICKCTDRDFYKVSTNTGNFYEFVNKECEVTNEQDIELFRENIGYEVSEKKKVKKGSED